ncbi:MAG: response regulator [bacterium]|nr:response regulator [bacterium]
MTPTDREAPLGSFVDNLPDLAVVLLDVDGKVLTWNAGAQALLGYRADEVVGWPLTRFFAQEDVALLGASNLLSEARAKGRHEGSIWYRRNDRTQVYVQSVLSPIYGPDSKVVGYNNLLRAAVMRTAGDKPDPQTAASSPKRESKKILVVDDDEQVRAVTLDQLRRLGYDVIAAANGDEALEILGRVTDIDLLFTDIRMPGDMNGRQVADEAKKLHPGLRVLFMSGYFPTALVREGILEPTDDVLVKPYRKAELAKRVVEALAASARLSVVK